MPNPSELERERIEALEPMYPRFNEMAHVAVQSLMPDGFDTTADASLCDTLDKVKRHYRKTGRVLVWTGESDNTIFGTPEDNHAFRAWHDYVHINFDLPFTKQGEHTVMLLQQRHVDTIGGYYFTRHEKDTFVKLLECEIAGQLDEFIRTGDFVKDQRAFAKQFMQPN